MRDVHRAWQTMLVELKLPTGREWMPYILRHSLATILRNRRVAKWDLEGFMGHRPGSTTETYAIGQFETVRAALAYVLEEIEALAPGAMRRNGAEVALSDPFSGELKMTG